VIRELAQGIDGLVTIALVLPGQALRTYAAVHNIPQPLGDTMKDNYYYGNPQLFKMPPGFQSQGAFDTSKAIPYVAIGVAGLIAYSMFFKKKKR